MAAEAGRAYVGISFDPEDIRKLGATAREAGKFAGVETGKSVNTGLRESMAGLGKTLALSFGGIFAASEAFNFGKEVISEAAQTQKATENIRASFGKASESILKFGDNAATSFGISKAASEGFASQIGLVTKNLGLGKQQGADMAVGLQKLAGAVGLIKGQDPSNYFDKLKSALLGNTRGLKDMGIAFTSAQEKHQALLLGIKASSADWTAAQKAQIIYQLAIKQLPSLMQEAKKHSGDLADQTIKLNAQWSNLKEELGAALLPVLTKVVTAFATYLPRGIAEASKAWKSIKPTVSSAMKDLRQDVSAAVDFVRALWKRFGSTIIAIVKTDFHTVVDVFKSELQIMRGVFEVFSGLLKGDWGKVWQGLKDIVAGALHGVVAIIKNLTQNIYTVASAIGEAIIHGIEHGVTSLASSLASTIKNTVTGGLGKLGSALGISSPSRWTRDHIGRPLAQGIALGFMMEDLGRAFRSHVGTSLTMAMPQPTLSLAGMSAAPSLPATVNAAATAPVVQVFIGEEQLEQRMYRVVDISNKRTARRIRAGNKWG